MAHCYQEIQGEPTSILIFKLVRNSLLILLLVQAFVVLKHGRNDLLFKTDSSTLSLSLFRTPLPSQAPQDRIPRLVRLLYVVCHDQKFSKEASDSSIRRLDLGLRLIQTFISESILKRFKSKMSLNSIKSISKCLVSYQNLNGYTKI